MLSSIQAGLVAAGGPERLAREGRPLVVCPVDFPAISGSTVARLLQALADGATIAVPTHGGRRGHPLAIGPELAPAVADLDLGVGLRQLLDRDPSSVVEVAVDDEGVILDVNTPEDYERALARARSGSAG